MIKLNYEYCKKCDDRGFFYIRDNILSGFYCHYCGCFDFECYKIGRAISQDNVFIQNVKESMWKEIKSQKILRNQSIFERKFSSCPYQLEHLVDQDETQF